MDLPLLHLTHEQHADTIMWIIKSDVAWGFILS